MNGGGLAGRPVKSRQAPLSAELVTFRRPAVRVLAGLYLKAAVQLLCTRFTS